MTKRRLKTTVTGFIWAPVKTLALKAFDVYENWLSSKYTQIKNN